MLGVWDKMPSQNKVLSLIEKQTVLTKLTIPNGCAGVVYTKFSLSRAHFPPYSIVSDLQVSQR